MPVWAWLIVVFGAFVFGFIIAACCAAAGRADEMARIAEARRLLDRPWFPDADEQRCGAAHDPMDGTRETDAEGVRV